MLVITATETEWREVPDQPLPDTMTARVISPCTIHGLPRSVGELVEVDANTLRNLIAKQRLEEYVPAAAPVTAEEIKADINALPPVDFEERTATTLSDFGPKLERRGPGRPRKNP